MLEHFKADDVVDAFVCEGQSCAISEYIGSCCVKVTSSVGVVQGDVVGAGRKVGRNPAIRRTDVQHRSL